VLSAPSAASAPPAPAGAEAPAIKPAPPWKSDAQQGTSSSKAARKRTPTIRLALAGAAVVIVVSLALARYLAADEEYEVADASFGSQAAPSDPESTAEPTAKAAAAAPAPAVATRATAAVVVEQPVRPIAATPSLETAASAPSRKAAKVVAAIASAPAPIETLKLDTHPAEPIAPPHAAEVVSAPNISPPPVAATSAVVDEVTITGCLEIAKDEDGFRLADTEGEDAPRARSWRSGFFKKRPAPVDLIGSAEALSLNRDVGRRVAATGVLSSRKLKVSSVRVVAGSCS
jgi:hypothetical protein